MTTLRETCVPGLDIHHLLERYKDCDPVVLAAIIRADAIETAARIRAEALADSFGVYSSKSFHESVFHIANSLSEIAEAIQDHTNG